ncbi:type II secretion system ATPase GspE [bacterium]|nr:type II secretion system ATPase GspE [candidate division CSSED10-310 bacterium]
MSNTVIQQRFGEYLVARDLVSPEDLTRCLDEQTRIGKKIGEILVEAGYLSAQQMRKELSEYLGVPYVNLNDDELKPVENLDLSLKFMRQYKIFPLALVDDTLRLAMADPTDIYTLDSLRLTLGYEIEPYLADTASVLTAVETHFGSGASTMRMIIGDMSEEELEILNAEDDQDVDQLRDMASEAPVIRLVNLFISQALENRASDVHIEPFEGELRLRYRVDGVLIDMEAPPRRLQPAIISRVKIMAGLNIAERRLPQDGRIRLRIMGRKVDLRVSTVPTMHGESVVMRILDRSSVFHELTSLGFEADTFEQFNRLIKKPHGIILITGPTGSGKTTTLYGALDKINKPDKKIITVEDPVEYEMQGINQIQVNSKIGLTFASGLRHIVRQDPDVILVGEIRDRETAEIAVQSSLTGHLVFSTLHTNDAPGAITRLVDMGIESFLVSSCVEGIMAQRLVRVICEHCKQEVEPDWEALEGNGLNGGFTRGMKAYAGAGCKECGNTGYRGRLGIFELLLVDDRVREMILQRASSTEIRKVGRTMGMRTLRDDGWRKVKKGLTTIEEVLRVTQDDDLSLRGRA